MIRGKMYIIKRARWQEEKPTFMHMHYVNGKQKGTQTPNFSLLENRRRGIRDD